MEGNGASWVDSLSRGRRWPLLAGIPIRRVFGGFDRGGMTSFQAQVSIRYTPRGEYAYLSVEPLLTPGYVRQTDESSKKGVALRGRREEAQRSLCKGKEGTCLFPAQTLCGGEYR